MFDLLVTAIPSTQSFTRQQHYLVCQTASGIAEPSPEVAKLDQLARRVVGWDGHGSPAPSRAAIRFAKAWLDQLKAVTEKCGRPWTRPLINSSAESEITFEWWSETRKLTVYFTDSGAEYVRVWGSDIDDQMDSGDLTTSDEFRDLWNWLRR